MGDWKDALLPQVSAPFREIIRQIPNHAAEQTREIRIRVNKPVILLARDEIYLNTKGICEHSRAYCPAPKEMEDLLEAMCGHSVYAHEEELMHGFISLRGGFRAGLSGHVSRGGDGVYRMSYVGGVALRVARAIPGVARPILPHALVGKTPKSMLIISPPGMGKTTMLRDLVRLVSNSGVRICVADERGEVAACHKGVAQLDVGLRTDVIDGCNKEHAVRIALRALSPQVIATDEIGLPGEAETLRAATNSGVAVFATAHAKDWREAYAHPELGIMLKAFSRVVTLGGRMPGESVTIVEAATGRMAGGIAS